MKFEYLLRVVVLLFGHWRGSLVDLLHWSWLVLLGGLLWLVLVLDVFGRMWVLLLFLGEMWD